MIQYESSVWGQAVIGESDLELLAEQTGLEKACCLQRLSDYRLEEMAAAWGARNPMTPKEIRDFYATTDLYLWELLSWHGSEGYRPYFERLNRIVHAWPATTHPAVLDYGAGVGTAALKLSQQGYRVTIADIPGKTLNFAKARLARHGFDVEVIEVTQDLPPLRGEEWDLVVSFDVVEHVPNPGAVGRLLASALRTGGAGIIVASFDAGSDELWPHHLSNGKARFSAHRWQFYMQSLGLHHLGSDIYSKARFPISGLLKLRYLLWRATGFHVQRFPR